MCMYSLCTLDKTQFQVRLCSVDTPQKLYSFFYSWYNSDTVYVRLIHLRYSLSTADTSMKRQFMYSWYASVQFMYN